MTKKQRNSKNIEHTNPNGTQSRTGQERKRALIEGTINSLAKRGVAGTTISTICEASGSSRGLITHYFGSKEALLAQALQHVYSTVSLSIYRQMDKPELTARERLTLFPEALFSRSVFTQKNRSVFLCLWHETRFNKIVRTTNQKLYRGYVLKMEELFFQAAIENTSNYAGLKEKSKAAAIGFISLSDGLWLGMSIHDRLIDNASAIGHCKKFIDSQFEILHKNTNG
ncbi:MAG: TetR family transcriptional regulator [Oceanicoccus sp.]